MQNISMDELRQALDGNKVAGLYDSRGPGSFGNLHIKGAKQLSVSDTNESNLPGDKDAMLVFY